jgi:hypothetical protein
MQNKFNTRKHKLATAEERLNRTSKCRPIDPRQLDWVNKLLSKTKEIK